MSALTQLPDSVKIEYTVQKMNRKLTNKLAKIRSLKMKIIYKSENDATEFDMDRYLKSLNEYGKVTKEQVEKALEEYEGYDMLHYTVLIEKALELLPDEDSARAYFEDHKEEGRSFERLRRITGGAECCSR